MKLVEPLVFSTTDELKLNLPTIIEELKSSSIVGIRGLKLSKLDQLQLTKDLGDLIGWTPNNKTAFNHQYIENHSSNPKLENSSPDEIMLNWHLEHVDYDNYSPLIAGVWNMYKYSCSPDVGMTYFMDSREVYSSIYTDQEKSFLSNCISFWTKPYQDGKIYENTAKVVSPHWVDGRDLIRIDMHHIDTLRLHTYKDELPSEEQSKIFNELISRFVFEVFNNTDLRIIHKWNEGDILIPDLYALAHAVTGGFTPEEREFSGYWCYLNLPENLQSGNSHPSWS